MVWLVAGAEVPTLDQVRDHLSGVGLAKQKWPESLYVVDDFPRPPSGKVQKFIVRQQVRGHADMSVEIQGDCPPEFDAVRDAFVDNFQARGEVGAALAVTIEGELVLDLWGGWADASRSRPWEQGTIVNAYSCTKAATAVCAHILADRGELDLDAPVASYWPEFAAAGKGAIPVRWLLSHRAGLMGPRRQLSAERLYDWEAVCTALAESEPWLPPGGDAAYHGITFGFLVGEVVRRISGRSLGSFLRDEVTAPLGISRDLYVGCPPEEFGRCADVLGSLSTSDDPAAVEAQRALYTSIHPSLESYLRIPVPGDQNSPEWRTAEIPAANGHMSARGLAGLYAPLANDGTRAGRELVSAAAIERMRNPEGTPGDLLIGPWVPEGQTFQWLSGFMNNLGGAGPNPRAFGHGGFGGSYGFADPERRLSYGYVMNQLSPLSTSGTDPRSMALVDALFSEVS